MKPADYVELSFANLWKRKLRTFLTAFGVTIGIGALVSMISFGKGMQKNVTETFTKMELFNYISVFPKSMGWGRDEARTPGPTASEEETEALLDEEAIEAIRAIRGVDDVLPDIRFPAAVLFQGQEEFSLVQVLPARFAASSVMSLRAGYAYTSDEEASVILSDSLLRRLGIKDYAEVVGQEVEIATLVFDFAGFNPFEIASYLRGEKLPFAKENYTFKVVGVAERMGFGGPAPLRSDVFLPSGVSGRMNKLPFSNLWDLFRSPGERTGYSVVNVRVSSAKEIIAVKERVEEMGFRTFALLDQMAEIKTAFLYMDMILAAVGMIAIVVAALGIINTMVMSILERYNEIGIMKAVGASDLDIQKIFFFESSIIGFLGGVFGLALGWVVSQIINRVINYFLAKQGVPFIEYFSFPWWLLLGAVAFAVLVSLVSGIYPAMRAARVDPVRALRHD